MTTAFCIKNKYLTSINHWLYNKEKINKILKDDSLLLKFYTQKTPNVNFNEILEQFDTMFLNPENNIIVLDRIIYDEKGEPKEGFIIKQNKNQFNVETYFNNQLKESKKKLN